MGVVLRRHFAHGYHAFMVLRRYGGLGVVVAALELASAASALALGSDSTARAGARMVAWGLTPRYLARGA